jgi:hypothetical protein
MKMLKIWIFITMKAQIKSDVYGPLIAALAKELQLVKLAYTSDL